MGTNPAGGWADIWLNDDDARHITGELLAASPDSLWISGRVHGGYVVSRKAAHGRVYRYQPASDLVGPWAAVGVFSTLSNGFLLVLTAPAWIITGVVATSHDVKAAAVPVDVVDPSRSNECERARMKRFTWAGADTTACIGSRFDLQHDQVRMFSRFPQGMPRGMDSAYTRLGRLP